MLCAHDEFMMYEPKEQAKNETTLARQWVCFFSLSLSFSFSTFKMCVSV